MTKNTLKFLFWVVIVYVAILLITRGFVNSDAIPAVSLTAIPLIIMAIIIIRDLTSKSVHPIDVHPIHFRNEKVGNQLEFLSNQIEVTVISSGSYFDDVVRARLRELLVTKASLQTGIETQKVRRILSDHRQGPIFLHDNDLYRLLYSKAPKGGEARIDMVREAVTLIENWKA